MSALSFRSVAITATSAIVALSLVACEESRLTVNTKKDGSIEVVAASQVKDDQVTTGIEVGTKQGIAIDPSGIEDGSFHVQVVLIDEDEDDATTGTEGTGTTDATTDGGTATDKAEDSAATTDTTTSSSAKGGETIAGKVDSSLPSSDADGTKTVTPQDGTIVFGRTLSVGDVVEGEDNILTVTNVDEGYYHIFVSANYAKGKVVIRAYDLSSEELADREAEGAYNKVKEIFKGLSESLSGDSNADATEAPEATDEEAEVADETDADATAKDDAKAEGEVGSKTDAKTGSKGISGAEVKQG